jgi:hypothetical protein
MGDRWVAFVLRKNAFRMLRGLIDWLMVRTRPVDVDDL